MSGTPCPKTSNYRSKALLNLAKETPYCMACNVPNHGQIVGAHSNRQKDGKGMGIKAHDLVAYLCEHCHDRYDGRDKPELSHEEWLEALYGSVIWLLSEGCITVKNSSR